MEQVNPVLVEVLRNGHVESIHRGSYCISDINGVIIGQAGDADTPVFPRSTVKLIQAIPLVETGAARAFKLSARELALTCASHNGETAHTEAASGILKKSGANEQDLDCGSHWPMLEKAGHELARTQAMPCQLHNNCSGKHAGFLACLKHNAIIIKGYTDIEHPLQLMIRKIMEDVLSIDLAEAPVGIDGCNIPTWAASLKSLAHGFARLSSPYECFEQERAQAITVLTNAIFENPYMIAGEGRYDTRMMDAFKGRLFVKTGAEGMFTAFLPEAKIGIAVKCDDGSFRGSENILTGLLLRYNILSKHEFIQAGLKEFLAPVLLNRNGVAVGQIKTV